jgi:hypothetical protein
METVLPRRRALYHQEPYSVWANTSPIMPPRSHLYHLAPIGVGTPVVESLTGYIMRLAHAHNVSTRTLAVEQLFPLYGRPYLRHHSLRRFWDEQTRAFNGTSTSTHDLVRLLEHLTCRPDLRFLTMLSWVHVLPPRGLLRPQRAWCPLCYVEWRGRGEIIYEPLIWSLAIVTVCPLHRQELCDRCPSCQSCQVPLEPHACPGYCGQCGRWLGDPKEFAAEPWGSLCDISYDVWVATMVGEVLAHAAATTCLPARNRIAAVVAAYVEHAAGGSNAAFARLLGCSKYTIRDCCRGEQLLQLGTLVKLCETVGVSLLQLLTDETLLVCLPPIPRTILPRPRSYHGSYRQIDKGQLRRLLQAEVTNLADPPKSLRILAAELGFDLSYLVKQCPEEAQMLKARYATYVEQRKQRTREQLFRELRDVMAGLVGDGIYPSQKRVAAQLSRPWFLRLPEARVAWRQLLTELGNITPKDETR